MKEYENPADYFPYIGHNIDHKKQKQLPIYKSQIGKIYAEGKRIQDSEDRVSITGTPSDWISHLEVNGLIEQKKLLQNPKTSEILIPRHKTLCDYTLGQPIHYELVKQEVMVLAGNNLFVAQYDKILRTFGGIMFMREDVVLKQKGFPKVFLSQKKYINEVFPSYLRQQMIDGVEVDGKIVRHDMIMYPEQEKHPITKKRGGGRTKTGQLRELSHLLFDKLKGITKDTDVKLYMTPMNVSLSKIPEVPYIAHPVTSKGLKRAIRYAREQYFVYHSYPHFAQKNRDAKVEIIANYGKPELFSYENFESMRDIMHYSKELKKKIGLLESIFPIPFLFRIMDKDTDISIEEVKQRGLELFENYKALGIHLDRVSDGKGNMMAPEDLIERSIKHLHSNPSFHIKEVKKDHILCLQNGRLHCYDNRLRDWYANNIRHLD